MQYEQALDWYGLTFGEEKKDDDKNNDETKKNEKKPWTGFSAGGSTISRVESGSPAAKAGLNVGDEVIAINGYRVDSGSVAARLKQYKVGDVVNVLTSRRQQIIERKLTLTEQPKGFKLKLLKKPTDSQTENLRVWLGLPKQKAKDKDKAQAK